MATIQPLSQKTLKDTIALTNTVFPWESRWGSAAWAFRFSLIHPRLSRILFLPLGIRWAHYWVAINGGKTVLGVTGLYRPHKDTEAYWLGWTCVAPEARGQRIGSQLLDFAIEQTKKAGVSYLRLYTWDGEEATVARQLYERRGFQLTHTEKLEEYSLLYYELPLVVG
jgi:GNAT superfamily N-acetyltransferase